MKSRTFSNAVLWIWWPRCANSARQSRRNDNGSTSRFKRLSERNTSSAPAKSTVGDVRKNNRGDKYASGHELEQEVLFRGSAKGNRAARRDNPTRSDRAGPAGLGDFDQG